MEPEATSIRVLGIAGSLRSTSHTRACVAVALEGAARLGATTEHLDLRELDLPLCDGEDEFEDHAGVTRLRAAVKAADGLVLGTPEYHGGYSGVLKNALDLMGFDELEGKLIGLIGVAGGAMGGFGALTSLRDVGRSLHAWVVPSQALVPHAWKQVGKDGQIADEKLRARLEGVGEQVTRFAVLHRSTAAQEFLRLWEQAPENPGGA